MKQRSKQQSKKRFKSEYLLNIISRYQFLLFGIIGHIYLLLLISIPAEFHGILGFDHTTFINVVSLVSMVILAVLLTMQWTGPMLNEVPIIVIMIWILLSTQSTSYCICCNEDVHHHHHHHPPPIHGDDVHQYHGEVIVDPMATTGEIVSIMEEGGGGGDDDDGEEGVEHHHHHNPWNNFAKNCSKETFYLFYSTLSTILLLASIFVDIRNYYASLFIRAVVVALIFILIILLVVSPGSCTQFSVVDSSFVILRITLYHILWFMNHYRGLTERVLEMNYSNGLQIANSHSTATTTTKTKKPKPVAPLSMTPLVTLSELDRVSNTLVATPTTSTPTKKRSKILLPMSDDDSSDDGSDSSSEEEVSAIEENGGRITKYVKKLVQLNHLFYNEAWLSWKNRTYNRNILRIIDLARTIWVLAVSPLWLVILVPVETIWLLYHIRKNTTELLETNKITGILSYEYDYLNKER